MLNYNLLKFSGHSHTGSNDMMKLVTQEVDDNLSVCVLNLLL